MPRAVDGWKHLGPHSVPTNRGTTSWCQHARHDELVTTVVARRAGVNKRGTTSWCQQSWHDELVSTVVARRTGVNSRGTTSWCQQGRVNKGVSTRAGQQGRVNKGVSTRAGQQSRHERAGVKKRGTSRAARRAGVHHVNVVARQFKLAPLPSAAPAPSCSQFTPTSPRLFPLGSQLAVDSNLPHQNPTWETEPRPYRFDSTRNL